MLYHMRLALRHLLKRKLYSVVIIASLALGFACTNFLITFVISETQTDNFHPYSNNTYQLFSNDPFGDNGQIAYIPASTRDYIGQNFAEAKTICQVGILNNAEFVTANGSFRDVTAINVDDPFFSVFNFPLRAGSSAHALGSDKIVISKAKAQAWFSTEDVLDKLITLEVGDTSRVLKIAGILDDAPGNSHLHFDVVMHHSVLSNLWGGGASYIVMPAGSHTDSFVAKINKDSNCPGLLGPGSMRYSMAPLQDSYFNATNKMPFMRTRSQSFVTITALVCGLIMIMSSFNFINLLLLSIQARAKEAGVKKTLGISVLQMLNGALAEIFLYVLSAFVFALLLLWTGLPYFNTILETSLSWSHFTRLEILLTAALVVTILGVIAVIWSAIHQWRIPSVRLMKNARVQVSFNKTLFTLQFVISITLAICATTIIRQMNFLENEPLGFNRNIILLSTPGKHDAVTPAVLKQQLLQIPGIQQVALCNGHPISGNSIVRYDLEDDKFYTPYLFSGDEDYIRTLHLTLTEGKLPAAGSTDKLVNQKLVKYFNLKQPVGELIPGTKDRISGVVKDFTCVSFKEEIPPAIIATVATAPKLVVDFSGSDWTTLIPRIEAIWKAIYPADVFSYRLIQEDLLQKYKADIFFYKTIVSFSAISMLISCFGLFALSWAVASGKTKEIGIRKVLGARTEDILQLLTVTFVTRIAAAFILAAPVAYYLMQGWLENFVYRISLSIMLFVITAALVLVIAIITLSFQTIKAALTNPVEELKSE
jgi:putative ABC transport system permease protein